MMALKSSTTAEYDKRYKGLDKAQKSAVDAIEGPVMVIAGPGTGKTTILSVRIANIISSTDTAPENILALTFTESGAFAMRRKLIEIIGPAAYKVNIHTFHGFAQKIFEQYPDYFPRIIGSTIISDAEQIKIVEKIIRSDKIDLLRPYGNQNHYVKPALREISILKRENISPAQFKKSLEEQVIEVPEELTKSGKKKSESASKAELIKLENRLNKNKELAFVYEQYEKELADKKYYDFDDMLLKLIRTMEENSDFKLIIQENYQYILADEHQDANAAQNRILELLADFHDSPNLFIVGDDKQAIYRFQGASLDNFLYFKKKYKNALVIDLDHSYRSHQGILDASHSVISRNPGIPGHERLALKSLRLGTSPISVAEFGNRRQELEYLANTVAGMIERGEKSEEIAILYRENKDAREISFALESARIPHRIESDHNILGDIDAIKIIMLCRAINEPSNDENLAQVLLLPEMKTDPAEVSELCVNARRAGLPIHLAIKQSKNATIKNAYAQIVKWSREAQTLPFADFLHRLIQETQMIKAIAESADSLERLSSLELFYDQVVKAAHSRKDFFIKDFIEYIGIISEHGINSKRKYAEHVGGVRLMTAHRAKGLEFDHVFIVHVVDGVWGNRNSRSLFNIPIIEHARDAGRIEDERRLFYVALTRARESVTITFSSSNGEKDTVPSQFIAEIDQKLVDLVRPEAILADQNLFAREMALNSMKKASVVDPGFVRSKFLSQALAVTHVNNFLKCPWQYFFVNLIRIPQAPDKSQMYGTAVHAALRSFFEAYKEERDFNKKKLIEVFKFHLDKQPLGERERAEAFKKGKKALEGYYDTYYPAWQRRLLTEFNVKGVQLKVKSADKVENLELTGKLDKVEFLDEVNVIVTDYKTGKPKSRNEIEGKTQTSDGAYKRQLVFYKLLLKEATKYNLKFAEIDFIEPNDRDIYKKERFEITDAEIADLIKVVEEMAQSILTMDFTNHGCREKDCQFCKLGKILGEGKRKE